MESEPTRRLSRLTPIADVLARAATLARPVAAREAAIADAEGRVLAADACVSTSWPAGAIALRDGWAVRAETIADAGPYTPVPIAAPQWVDAGMAMPPTADAILPRDAVMLAVGAAEALSPATSGDGVLAAGADAAPGKPLRRAGETLRAVDVAALQRAGVARVSIREPRVRVVSVGADAVALAISRGVAAHGANVIFVRALERALADEHTDLVITIGGTGEGRDDGSVALLARMGEILVHGFGIAPGEAAAFGVVKGHPVLMLPDRLDAALAAFLIVGRPLLRGLGGSTDADTGVRLPLARKIVSTVGLAEVIPVRRVGSDIEPLASGHWPLQALTRADGWVLVPPESEGFAAGTLVEMRAFP